MNSFDPESITTFELQGYDFEPASGRLSLQYALLSEEEPILLTEQAYIPVNSVDPQTIEVAECVARLLFLVASTSYYKVAAPPRVVVGIPITKVEKQFLRDIIHNGMTEFAYVNNLPQALSPTIEASQLIAAEPIALPRENPQHPLVPVGGGKDSIVTIEALRAAGFHPTLFAVNSYAPITDTVERADLPYLEVRRVLDPQLSELNELGARNGHVPVTLVNSLLALLTATMNGMNAVVMSNERSASVGNLLWHGIDVNHQWAKSLEAEKLLQETLGTVVSPTLEYFSLLRPFSELRIARQFAKLSQYHDVFTSCNRAFHLDPSKRQVWCGQCDKCRFVFLILAPYMSRKELVAIWHKDLLDEGDHLAEFRELLGIQGHKPLECVGEVEETRLALQLLTQKDEWKNTHIVRQLLAELPPESMPSSTQVQEVFATGSHRIPETYLSALDEIK